MPDPMSSARRHAAVASVVDTYVTVLDRAPTPAELMRWADALAAGATAASLRDDLEGSDEFRQFRLRAPLRAAVEQTGLFDAAWYLLAYPDIAAAGVDPLNHYVLHGRQEDRSPNAWLQPRWYRQKRRHYAPARRAPFCAALPAIGRGTLLAPSTHSPPTGCRQKRRSMSLGPALVAL